MAVSIESEPPLVRKTLESGMGTRPATRSASSSVTGVTMSPKVEYVGSFAICAAAASPISRRPHPTLQYQRDAVASR